MSCKSFPAHSANNWISTGAAALVLALGVAFAVPASADPPGPAVKKLGSKRSAVQVDNGWVISNPGKKSTPVFFNAEDNPDFQVANQTKLKPGVGGSDKWQLARGIVFAPCPAGQNECQASEDGTEGIGIAFGDMLLKAGNKSIGGWQNDDNLQAKLTNTTLDPGSIYAVAVGTGGAFAVGDDTAVSGFREAVVIELDSTGHTYAPISKTFLSLGGKSGTATNLSKNAIYITGTAQDPAKNKWRAVYAMTGDTAWTDLTPKIPDTIMVDGVDEKIIKARTLAANDTGIIAGSVTVKVDVAGKTNTPVDIGFVYDVGADSIEFFQVPGASVVPLKVLPSGQVIGNLVYVKEAGTPGRYPEEIHPFLIDGSTLTDFMTLAAGPFAFYYGCEVGMPNNLGEVVGTCVPDQFTPYKETPATIPFYLDMLAGSPAFLNVNTAIHTNQDALISNIVPYHFGAATSIDDQHEITLYGNIIGKRQATSFFATKAAYNP